MEFWPADFRPHTVDSSAKKGRSATKRTLKTPWSYPILDRGAPTAATLEKRGGGLRWVSIENRSKGGKLKDSRVAMEIFPATIAMTKLKANHTVQKRAEEGARFIRTRYPDVDIPLALITDELEADEKLAASQRYFDPFAGNAIESVYWSDGPQKRSIVMAFPMGRLGQQLNVSPFTSTSNSLTFEPTASPAWSFGTPIQQIISSSTASHHAQEKPNRILAIRTFGQTTLIDLHHRPRSETLSNKNILLSKISVLDSSDLKSRQLMDMAFSRPSSSMYPALWLVNEHGSVFQCTYGEGYKSINCLFDSSPDDGDCSLWRIAAGSTESCGILASEKSVKLFDARVAGSNALLFTKEGDSLVTSIGPAQADHLVCLSTTSELIWLDDRYTKQPVLGWRHHRNYDRTLRIQTIDVANSSLTFLSSRNTGLVTVYGTSRSTSGLVHSCFGPRACPRVSPSFPNLGSTIIRNQSDEMFSFVDLSNNGNVYCLDLEYLEGLSSSPEREGRGRHTAYEWSDEVQDLDDKSHTLCQNMGDAALKECMEVDMSGIYKRLFGKVSSLEDTDPRTIDTLYDTLEKLPFFQQHSDVDVDHIRTTFDLIFSSGEEPARISRADFFTGTVLDSVRGYRAFKQGRVPTQEMARRVPWHLNLRHILHHIAPEIPLDPSSSPEDLLPYLLDSKDGTARPPLAVQHESEACEQLAMDLSLSTDIFSTLPFNLSSPRSSLPQTGEASEASTMLSQATEAMSLSQAEPPPVQFAFLRPLRKGHYNRYDVPHTDHTENETLSLSLGVRLLLSEWEIGNDPQGYEYRDPYNDSSQQRPWQARTSKDAIRSKEAQTQAATQSTAASQPRQPPVVVTATSLKPSLAMPSQSQVVGKQLSTQLHSSSQPRRIAESQFTQPYAPLDESSQPYMTSTQILPGPFGGRQNAVKKKAPKKRVGGF